MDLLAKIVIWEKLIGFAIPLAILFIALVIGVCLWTWEEFSLAKSKVKSKFQKGGK